MNQSKWFKGAVVLSLTTSAIVVPMQAQAAGFSDVDANSESGKAIQGLVDRGIIRGYSDGTFKPNQHVTRAQAASILGKVLQLDTTNIKNPEFKDVGTWHQNYKEIAALAQAGIMPGYANGEFKLYRAITREEMAEILVRAFHLKAPNKVEMPFDDVRVGSELYDLVEALYALNVTKGASATKFGPNDVVTRSQFALFITRAEAVKGKPVDPIDPDPVDPVDPDPIDPVDPVDPEPVDPVDPVDPIDPEPTDPGEETVVIKATDYDTESFEIENSIDLTNIATVKVVKEGVAIQAKKNGEGYLVLQGDSGKVYLEVEVDRNKNIIVSPIDLADTSQEHLVFNSEKLGHAIDHIEISDPQGIIKQGGYEIETTKDEAVIEFEEEGDYKVKITSLNGYVSLFGVNYEDKKYRIIKNESTQKYDSISLGMWLKSVSLKKLDRNVDFVYRYDIPNSEVHFDISKSDAGVFLFEFIGFDEQKVKKIFVIDEIAGLKSLSIYPVK